MKDGSLKRKQDFTKFYENVLRGEGLYPEPYAFPAVPLEEIQESKVKTAHACDGIEFVRTALKEILREKLTKRQRKILLLRVQGYTLSAIAKKLGVSISTVGEDLEKIRGSR